jgi:hypothetical protein
MFSHSCPFKPLRIKARQRFRPKKLAFADLPQHPRDFWYLWYPGDPPRDAESLGQSLYLWGVVDVDIDIEDTIDDESEVEVEIESDDESESGSK